MFANFLKLFRFKQYQTEKKYGWRKDKSDDRDYKLSFTKLDHKENGIKKVDLRHNCPPVYDQGKLGSCTANAIAAAYEYDMLKQKETNIFVPSRLFIYYNEREMEGHVDQDSGAEIRDGIKSINTQGVCPETEWPYDVSKFKDKPPQQAYSDAKNHVSVKYQRVEQDLEHMKECLSQGLPFVFGFMVYESFESKDVANTGIMVMPKRGEKLLGGHAVMAVGYDDDKQVIIVRNSWTTSWGDNGYFYMPYDYIKSNYYCNDFWVVQRVKDN